MFGIEMQTEVVLDVVKRLKIKKKHHRHQIAKYGLNLVAIRKTAGYLLVKATASSIVQCGEKHCRFS